MQVARTILSILPGPAQIDLKPLLAKCLFHKLWNYAQVYLIDLLISVNPGRW
jgi:hypothetical protein